MAIIKCSNKAIATEGDLSCSVKRNVNGKVSLYGNFVISDSVRNYVEGMLKRGASLAQIAAAVVRDEFLTQNRKSFSIAKTYGSHLTTSDGVILN